jgi:hypothetical protein
VPLMVVRSRRSSSRFDTKSGVARDV